MVVVVILVLLAELLAIEVIVVVAVVILLSDVTSTEGRFKLSKLLKNLGCSNGSSNELVASFGLTGCRPLEDGISFGVVKSEAVDDIED